MLLENSYEVLEKDPNLEDLFNFGKDLGMYINPKITYPVKFYPGYLGILAVEDIAPYETILTIPNDLMLSIKLSNTSELKRIFQDYPEDFAEGNGGENYRFIVYILSEMSKGPNSKWYYYLNTLPTHIETLTDWDYNQLLELQDDVLLEYIQDLKSNEAEGNTILKSILINYPDIINPEVLNKINWVWRILCTRTYGKCLPYLSLIPIADFFNHDNVNTSYYYGRKDEPDGEILDTDDQDNDDELPIKYYSISYYKLARLRYTKKSAIINELLEMARAEDRKLFLISIS